MNIIAFGFAEELALVENSIEDVDGTLETVIIDNDFGVDMWREELLNQYDYVVLAFSDSSAAQAVYDIIHGIYPDERIIDFFQCMKSKVPFMNVDANMQKVNGLLDGIILGISHAEVGIIPRFMRGNWCNLAVSSQDLYYNMKTLEYCINQYPDTITGLKYLVIDMFDYTYFNYDVSRSKMFFNYNSWGGYMTDPHNYSMNRNFDPDYETLMIYAIQSRKITINPKKEEIFNYLFGDIHAKTNYKYYSTLTDKGIQKNRLRIVDDMQLQKLVFDISRITRKFDDTIEENIQNFGRIISLAREINPDIKIYTVMMPRYEVYMREYMKIASEWKQFFENLMGEIQKELDFEYIDFSDDDITKERNMFYDPTHLNYYGAMCFTRKLNQIIMGEI